MVIGIDHGYYAIKTKQVCFPTGIIRYEYEVLNGRLQVPLLIYL